MDIEHVPPSSLPTVVIGEGGPHNVDHHCNMTPARGRKRDSSSCIASQADRMANTSASVAEQIADGSEERPRKRRKRSSSTPAAPRSSQLSTQLQSRRRSRSRVGSPTMDVEHVLPSRVSARLSRKIHPFFNSRNSDIYTHLADPDGAGNLLGAPPAGSIPLSTPNEMVGPQSVKKTRGRRRKTTDLADENAKRKLIEEWARMRQSQGSLPLSGINENACFNQTPLHENRKDDGSVSSVRLDALTQRSSPDADLATSQTTTIVDISQSHETIVDISLQGSSLARMDFENALPMGTDTPGKKPDHKGSVLSSDGGIEHPIVPRLGIGAPSTSILESHVDEESPTGKSAGAPKIAHHPDSLECPGLSFPSLPASSSREDFVHMLTKFPENEQAEAESLNNLPEDSPSVTLPETYPFDTTSIHLDFDEEFYMLDIPEIFTLPWEPVSSHLYVPPSLGKLISGKQLFLVSRN